jgi:hypothetical protein
MMADVAGLPASPIGRGLPNLANAVSLVRKGEGFGAIRRGTNPSPHSPNSLTLIRLMALSLWERGLKGRA